MTQEVKILPRNKIIISLIVIGVVMLIWGEDTVIFLPPLLLLFFSAFVGERLFRIFFKNRKISDGWRNFLVIILDCVVYLSLILCIENFYPEFWSFFVRFI